MDPECKAIVLFTSTTKGIRHRISIDRRIPPSTILFTNIVSTIVNYTDTDLLQHELLLVQFTFCIRVSSKVDVIHKPQSTTHNALGAF